MNEEKIMDFFLGGSIVLALILLILVIAATVVAIIANVKLFKKADKPGWAAIVPFYNTYVLIEIAGLNWWYFLISISGVIVSLLQIPGLSLLTSCASMAVNFFIFYNLGKKFKQNPITFGVLGIFFGVILVMVLGFSNSMVYDKDIEVDPNGPIGENSKKNTNTATNNTNPEKFCLGCGQKLKPGVQFCEIAVKKLNKKKINFDLFLHLRCRCTLISSIFIKR